MASLISPSQDGLMVGFPPPPDKRITTANSHLLAHLGWLQLSPDAVRLDKLLAGALKQALADAAARDWPGALKAAQGAGPVGGDLILWQWLRDGQGKLGDYESFLQRRPDWPGFSLAASAVRILSRSVSLRMTAASLPVWRASVSSIRVRIRSISAA